MGYKFLGMWAIFECISNIQNGRLWTGFYSISKQEKMTSTCEDVNGPTDLQNSGNFVIS